MDTQNWQENKMKYLWHVFSQKRKTNIWTDVDFFIFTASLFNCSKVLKQNTTGVHYEWTVTADIQYLFIRIVLRYNSNHTMAKTNWSQGKMVTDTQKCTHILAETKWPSYLFLVELEGLHLKIWFYTSISTQPCLMFNIQYMRNAPMSFQSERGCCSLHLWLVRTKYELILIKKKSMHY